MRRVAALYLPQWPIDRLRRAERRAQHNAAPTLPVDLDPLRDAAVAEQEHACSVPRGGGWRPGARWAREDQLGRVAKLPVKPAKHELGRREEPVAPPFRAMRPDEGGPILPGTGRGTATRSGVVEGAGHKRVVKTGAPSTTAFGGGPQSQVDRAPRDLELPGAIQPETRSGEDLAPRVTALREGNRVLVGAADAAARQLGLTPGMTITHARVLVPELDIQPADPEGDNADLHRLAMRLARRCTPIVAVEGSDTLFLDLTGTAHLYGGEARMVRRLVKRLARRGIMARIAVADTPGAAWALSRYQPGICPPDGHTQALSPLPIAALRLDPAHVELLHRLGIERIGQLIEIPRGPLVRRFDAGLVLRLDQALGHAREPLQPVLPPEPIMVEQRFAEPIATAEAIEHWLEILVARLAMRLAEAGLGARTVELIADRIDGVPQVIRIGLARASRDKAHLLRLMVRRIETIEPGYGVDALHLHLRRAEPLGPQPVTERLDEEAAPDLAPLVDTLATRIGSERLWRMQPIESDIPERSSAPMPVLDPPTRPRAPLKRDDVRRLDRSGEAPVWHPNWPRPTRLLSRPEPLDHVVAELPDQPPRRFTWRGRMHQVVRADGPERITGEWWRRRSETLSIRDYFQVEDEGGQRFWLFRKGDGERAATGDLSWYLYGVFG